ncbi:unnamed protein product [Nesidiocoris tenuis]|uniref:Uncharacterized protein n=1 Tax=Nesidiocoris tenuis TaxID=355587 RepID=A0A6H5HCP1_9HEMI|nr:unnamed protein product [Nesidiocoris tenuis]
MGTLTKVTWRLPEVLLSDDSRETESEKAESLSGECVLAPVELLFVVELEDEMSPLRRNEVAKWCKSARGTECLSRPCMSLAKDTGERKLTKYQLC